MNKELYDLLGEHIEKELKEGYEVEDINDNDLDGIIWNIHEDINERISEYYEAIEK